MAVLKILNDRIIGTVVNEVKAGKSNSDSCDPGLYHLGEVELAPGEEYEFHLNDDDKDIYWKNIYESYWAHKGIFGRDLVTISASHLSSTDEVRRDHCN
ncbi:hypothetical protein [uncultured Desulfobacter sp.]|uniref:hypothetical protein n=1 Tax=uncultured Desulfobacter sp. TaxID=240139 RepID=UPI0029C7A828|nr:hypothetical protein [uncultured Desulfobacter sp.]